MTTLRIISGVWAILLIASLLLGACGDGGKSAAEKARQDSIRIADSIARLEAEAKRVQDSINALPKSIAQTLQLQPNLSKLVAALQTAGLTATLEAENNTNYTVFAPTDSALNVAKIDELMKPANKARLERILKLHVVENLLPAANLKNGMKLRTLAGYDIAIKVKNNKIFVDGREVIQADIKASNGVIHVIKEALKPKMVLQ
ncbi:MAG: fasciclin domain-containing protein [Cytophagales bacterium]|nr:fasciclin domain-containing protein [Bernardetiaceae bacterium]MDW8204994.1 fasciclin domain-containing protein [Cytophagales bacterium]